ncbi:hypothetical protein Taro_013873 [Colocasia esculenta]|uniref:Uncharacterized protein n=1 Tax=Colocasia esculenta TaxID=4460 RepID=A0A843UGP8_COLES|nr:hypothetical protein [Colocasia esculenta]
MRAAAVGRVGKSGVEGTCIYMTSSERNEELAGPLRRGTSKQRNEKGAGTAEELGARTKHGGADAATCRRRGVVAAVCNEKGFTADLGDL